MPMPIRWQLENAICQAYESQNSTSSALHGHHQFLLTLITRGTGVQTLNGRQIPFGPKDLFLLSPADFHQNAVPHGQSYDHFGVQFSYELLDASLVELCSFHRLPLHLHLSGAAATAAEKIFSQLVEESQNGESRPAHLTYMRTLVMQLLILALREAPPVEDSPSGAFINRALGYLLSHFHEDITVADAAAYAGYSPNYLNTCFRQQMGVPFQTYLRQVRLTYAENLLHASRLSTTQIALESGFGSLSHFSRSFHKAYGMSPQEYRKAYRNNKQRVAL